MGDIARLIAGIRPSLNSLLDSTGRLSEVQDAPVEILELSNQIQSFESLIMVLKQRTSFSDRWLIRILTLLDRARVELSGISSVVQRHTISHTEKQLAVELVDLMKWILSDRFKIVEFNRNIDFCIARLGVSLLDTTKEQHPNIEQSGVGRHEILIAVMGSRGSGKSHFIRQITKTKKSITEHALSPGEISSVNARQHLTPLQSGTQVIQSYSVTIGDRIVTLVDIPGFDDRIYDDVDTLEKVASWLVNAYKSKRLFSAIIYMNSITASHIADFSTRLNNVFAKIVGPHSFHNIFLVSTQWNRLGSSFKGELQETRLRHIQWKDFIRKGSIALKFSGSRGSALAILRRVAFDKRIIALAPGMPFAIQMEMVDKQKPLIATAAGNILANEIEALLTRCKSHLAIVPPENIEGKERIQVVIDRLQQNKKTLAEGGMSHDQLDFSSKKWDKVDTLHCGSLSIEELFALEQIPPSAQAASAYLEYILLLIEDPHFLLAPFRGHLRPRLRDGYNRLEWICSCGELLYGDYIEKVPGSLQNLVHQLEGHIAAGPAGSRNLSFTSSPATVTTTQLPLPRQNIASETDDTTRQNFTVAEQTHQAFRADKVTGNTNVSLVPQGNVNNKWLELCISSSPSPYVLGEVDVAGRQTDQTVFNKIRAKYYANKASSRLFGFLTLRIPKGGVFVQFRKDKLAAPSGKLATASVMVRPSVPNSQEAREYNYVFAPIPMDEPPMDPRTFNHYFQKPHNADVAETWIKRFPLLQDSSLYYSNEKLAKGWGIEITEDWNWPLLIITSLIGLLVSGAIASTYSVLTRDPQTGVAIGAWLTAAQALFATAVLWRWSND